MSIPSMAVASHLRQFRSLLVLTWLLVLASGTIAVPAHAAARVQEVTGTIEVQESLFYDLPGLRRGETRYLYAERHLRKL
jgi:hypothetical protein